MQEIMWWSHSVCLLEKTFPPCHSKWYEPYKPKLHLWFGRCQHRHKIKAFHWIILHIYIAGNFMGSQTCLCELPQLYFLLTHAGKCRASDSHSLISRFLVETPEPVGGLELEESAFFSVSTSTFHWRPGVSSHPECTLCNVCADKKGIQYFSK